MFVISFVEIRVDGPTTPPLVPEPTWRQAVEYADHIGPLELHCERRLELDRHHAVLTHITIELLLQQGLHVCCSDSVGHGPRTCRSFTAHLDAFPFVSGGGARDFGPHICFHAGFEFTFSGGEQIFEGHHAGIRVCIATGLELPAPEVE